MELRTAAVLAVPIASCWAATYVTRRHGYHRRIEASDAAEARDVVRTSAASASASAPCRVRVAGFADEESCDSPDPLARILDADQACDWEPVSSADVRSGRLGRFGVTIFLGGGRAVLQARALGDPGAQAVRDFVRNERGP